MNNPIISALIRAIGGFLKFGPENFTAADGTYVHGFNNWVTVVWYEYLFAGTRYSNQIYSNSLLVGSAYDRVEAKYFRATSYHPATKILDSMISSVKGSCVISKYCTSTAGDGGDCYIGYHIGAKTDNENAGFKVLIKFKCSGTWLKVYKGNTEVYSAAISLGNTDLNYWNFDIDVSSSKVKVWIYQGTKPTNPTHTYDGNIFSGINFSKTYCGEYSDLEKYGGNYETILGRVDNFFVQVS